MCAADTNFEAVDPDTRSSNGWGTVRECRDYDSVVSWAESHKVSSDEGIM
jgi:hypothetical protein